MLNQEYVKWYKRYEENIDRNKEHYDILVNKGIIVKEEYDSIINQTGCTVVRHRTIKGKIREIRNFLETYKWDKATWFRYDDNDQRNTIEDRILMESCYKKLLNKEKESIMWKYPPENYKIISDPEYFKCMMKIGEDIVEKAFECEAIIMVDILKETDLDKLIQFNPKERFDALFEAKK